MQDRSQDPTDRDGIAVVSLEITTSSDTLPRLKKREEDEDHMFEVIISARIEWSSRPDKAVTVLVQNTPLHGREPSHILDALAKGDLWLTRNLNGQEQKISFETAIIVRWANNWDPGPDIRNYDRMALLTIPAMGQGTVEVRHKMPWWRISRGIKLKNENAFPPGPEETWRVHMKDTVLMSGRWWCWGDINGDIKDKLVLPLSLREYNSQRGSRSNEIGEGLVVGEDADRVKFRILDNSATFRIR